MKTAEQFWSCVDVRGDDECWPWVAKSRHPFGYGSLNWNGKTSASHRVTVQLSGRDPTGQCVRHTCDNPPCCNPSHLILGTKAENNGDMFSRGRAHAQINKKALSKEFSGESNPQSKLTNLQRDEIFSSKDSTKALMARYGVSRATINRIKGGKQKWKNV